MFATACGRMWIGTRASGILQYRLRWVKIIGADSAKGIRRSSAAALGLATEDRVGRFSLRKQNRRSFLVRELLRFVFSVAPG